jgi:hypothetical protein
LQIVQLWKFHLRVLEAFAIGCQRAATSEALAIEKQANEEELVHLDCDTQSGCLYLSQNHIRLPERLRRDLTTVLVRMQIKILAQNTKPSPIRSNGH